ncbi:MAG: NAD(+) synthase [Clostridia bacterium]|nr:NAD(+) synthase [Clostridia bacterium]MCL6521472.1 NAD(+) synthase [Bacillota bacterium]
MAERVERLAGWLEAARRRAGAEVYVVGLSGGVDSAVTAALCRRTGAPVVGVLLPCHSRPEDERDAREVAESLGVELVRIDLAPAYDALRTACEAALGPQPERSLALANLKPRLRMATLYFVANARNGLVVGTGNRSELYVGYFTKYGDGGVDLLPLGGLVKSEVYELARELALPRAVLEKPPSAGLWPGQTDEGEMGLAYADLDRYLLTGQARPEVAERVEAMHRRSQHKRETPPVAPA